MSETIDDPPRSKCSKHATRNKECLNCRKASARWARWYRKHFPERHNRNRIKSKNRLKLKAIMKLGGKCVVCSETDPRVLQVNHKNGGGLAEIKSHPDGSLSIYRGIINDTRKTDDIDLRCANCNIRYEYERGTRQWLI